MSELFRDKYSEIILNKQKSFDKYQLAINNLLTAFYKRVNQEDKDLTSNEFAKSMHNTLNELEKIQVKKINIHAEQPVHSLDNFSNFYNFHQPTTPVDFEDIQKEFSQSLEPQQTTSAPEELKEDLSDSSQSLKPQQNPSYHVDIKDIENVLTQPLEPIQQSETLRKTHKKRNKKMIKNKQPLKVTIKNDAPPPPPWIPR